MIDVLLPFRGDITLMHAAVASVLAQDTDGWRLYVFDDADPDLSLSAWLSDLSDPRIEYNRAAQRQGVNRAFNHCLTLGSAELLTFMGCDDLMRADHLRSCLELAARHPDVAAVQPGVEVMDSDGRRVRPLGDRVKAWLRPPGEQVLGGEALAASLLHGNWLYFPSIVWRRAGVQAASFRPGLDTMLDLGLVMDLLLDGQQVVVSDAVTFDYRRHGASASSVTARSAERFTEGDRFYADIAARCTAQGWPRAAAAARLHLTTRAHTVVSAASAVRLGDLAGGRRLLRHATR